MKFQVRQNHTFWCLVIFMNALLIYVEMSMSPWFCLLVLHFYAGAMAYLLWVEPDKDFCFVRHWHWRMTRNIILFSILGFISLVSFLIEYSRKKSKKGDVS